MMDTLTALKPQMSCLILGSQLHRRKSEFSSDVLWSQMWLWVSAWNACPWKLGLET
ncbi:hypothetical protein LEMLEM_LOCUS1587 [Lemmus lemmus]